MKHLSYILLLFLSIQTSAQKKTDSINKSIPRGASIIYVSPVSFDAILKTLGEHNLEIGTILEGKMIVTRKILFWNGLNEASIHIRYVDSTAEIMGTYLWDPYISHYSPVRFFPMEYCYPSKKAFEALDSIARSLHGNIRYE